MKARRPQQTWGPGAGERPGDATLEAMRAEVAELRSYAALPDRSP